MDDRELEAFRSHLLHYGRSESTARDYSTDVRIAFEGGDPLMRLTNRSLAPKTRHRIHASLRAWARYRGDEGLLDDLARVRLPSPERKTAKQPLSEEEWWSLLDEIDRSRQLSDPMRGQLGLMAARGFRAGDVLRLHRHEIQRGLREGSLSFEAKGSRRLEFTVTRAWRGYLELLAPRGSWSTVPEILTRSGTKTAAAKAVERSLSKVAEVLGIEGVYPHRLRRTYATHYLRHLKGDPEALIKLQKHMQWAKLETAYQYVDYQERDVLDEAADAMMARRHQ